MAQLITVRLSRDGGSPWGFRLQGGKDFGTPLVIQKVNGGSPAERAGLIAGDSVIKVNTTDVFNLRHKDAQDVIVRAGQTFEMTVQRGGSTWKPTVTPVGSLPRSQPISNNVSPVTKTSLAAQKQDFTPIGASHNLSPKGFANVPHVNGDGPKLVNKQYNTPIGLYSEQSIAETLSAQAEVLSTGALGVNFKKNEKNYDAEKSEVYKMLQEAEREPRTPEPAPENDSGVVSAPVAPVPTGASGLRHVMAPIDRPAPPPVAAPTPGSTQLPPGQNICADCERLIVFDIPQMCRRYITPGVFVRIKDKNLHVECFKCATCGQSLKNVGYYNINNKLYCDIHAKLAARSNPPAPNMVPVTIPPGGKVPAGTISAALASHSMPSPSPLSPSGNQMAAPFSPQPKQDVIERYSPNNNYNPQKVDAVANLMSVLTLATQKDYRENGTNTDPVYLTEKIIPVNNSFDISDNGIRNDQLHSPPPPVKYMPFRPKSASSFTGPKPFSSVQPSTPTHPPFSSMQPSAGSAPIAAPLSNTLPRTGPSINAPGRFPSAKPTPAFRERKEWPPSKPEDLPTACPLYIDPSTRIPTPQLKMSYPQSSQIPVAQNPGPQNSSPQNPPHDLPFVPAPKNPYAVPQIVSPQQVMSNPQPSLIPITQNPISQNPGPQISYQYSRPAMAVPQNPGPANPVVKIPIPQITLSQNPPPSIVINETKMSSSQELGSEYKSSQEVSNVTQNLDRNMSVCSAEVTNITGRRNVIESVETVSGAIDTQMLVNQVTKTTGRPKSPPPVQRKDSVYDTQDISIVVSTNTPKGKNPNSENPVLTIIDEKSRNIEDIAICNPCNPQICPKNTCPMSNPDCTVKIITCPTSNPTCPLNVQQSTTNIGNVQRSTNIQGTSSDIQSTSDISQTASTSTIKNPVPQQYISPMVKALTVASDRPFNTVSVEIKSKEYGRGQTQDVIETTTTSQSLSSTSLKARQQVQTIEETETVSKTKTMHETKASQESKTVKSAKETKELKERKTMQSKQETKTIQESTLSKTGQKFTQEPKFPHVLAPAAVSTLASALTIAPPTPFNPTTQFTMEHVPLPPETTPYFPPEVHLIEEPKVQKQPVSCRSPFVDALTTASDRPYTPLIGGQEQTETPDYMKDIPPPSKQKMSMLSALTTATERAFTPALSVGSIEDVLLKPPEPPKPQHKVIATPPPIPLTIKPASHVSPSAFKPIGNTSFKPVPQTYTAQVSEVKSSYAPVLQSRSNLQVQQTNQMISQQQMDQYATQIQRQVDIQQARQPDSYGLHTASSIPEYQKNLARKDSGPVLVPQLQAPVQPIQKPITTLQPGQYQPNNHLQTFQPVRSTSPLPRAVSPSMINKAAPSLPYYQADLVAHECLAVGSNLLDPRSPGISRSPSPCPGVRGTSPFPRTMAKSPAQGPPPNPLGSRVRTQQPVRDEKYLEARENLSSYIPVYQERDEEIKSHLTMNYAAQSKQYGTQSQMSSRQSQKPAQCQPQQNINMSQYTNNYNQPQTHQNIAASQQAQSYSQSQSQQNVSTSQQSHDYTQFQVHQNIDASQQSQNPSQLQPQQYISQIQLSPAQPQIQNEQSHLSADQIYITTMSQPIQYSGQSEMSSDQYQEIIGQSQILGGQAHTSTQSQNYQNVQFAHSEQQQQSQNYRRSEVEDVRHMEELNKSQIKSVETSADNRIQIQRTKRCTEEFERTQKERTIEIQRTGLGQTQQINQGGYSVGLHQTQINQGASPTVPAHSAGNINQGGYSVGSNKASTDFQRQTGFTHPPPSRQTQIHQGVSSLSQSSPSGSKFPIKPLPPAAGPRSYSLPGSSAAPKQIKPSPLAATAPKAPVISQSASRPNVPQPYTGGAGGGAGSGRQASAVVAPKRGRGVLNLASAPGRVPMCGHCNMHIRGPFITALGKIWCPEHFICTTPSCRRPLQDMGFVEEKGQLYCEFCFEQYLAPICAKCNSKIKGDCLNAIGKHFHPECFACAYCSKLFGNSPFFLEDGLPYCEADWNELFTTKCFACGFPVEAGDRWVEALNNNYHSQCFNCTMCKKNLEGQSFYAKGGRPFCKNHAR